MGKEIDGLPDPKRCRPHGEWEGLCSECLKAKVSDLEAKLKTARADALEEAISVCHNSGDQEAIRALIGESK